jgi:hypothetical protein
MLGPRKIASLRLVISKYAHYFSFNEYTQLMLVICKSFSLWLIQELDLFHKMIFKIKRLHCFYVNTLFQREQYYYVHLH